MTTGARALALVLAAAAASCGPSGKPVDAAATSTATPDATPTPNATSTSTSNATPTATPTTPNTTSTPTPAPAPAPPPTPAPTVRSAISREPAGTTALSATAETVVDPASTFEVDLADRLPDARVVLVDAADAHVAAKDVREVGATTRLTLAPEAPLRPGSRYLLRVDGASVREMHDADGRAFAPVGFPVLVAGTPPPPEPKAPPKRKHRRSALRSGGKGG